MPTLTGLLVTSTSGAMTPPNHGIATLTLSSWNGRLTARCGGGVFIGVYPGTYTLVTNGGWGLPNGVIVSLSGAYPFTSRCGGGATLQSTTPYVGTASGTTENKGSAPLILSTRYGFVASGTTDAIGRAYLSIADAWPQYPHTIRNGGTAFLALSGYSKTTSGTTDRLGEVVVKLHRTTLSAHGYMDNTGTAYLVAPSMMGAPSGVVQVKLSRPILSQIGTNGAPTPYEAYSITLFESPNGDVDTATTHYTNYPFDRFVRFNGLYYGIGATGMFELNGDTFDGAPILSTVETANTDFETPQMKRPISLYIAGEVGADFKVTVNSAEVRNDSYNYRSVDKTGARNYRVVFGKGIRARYLSYAFTNTNGGDFVLDDLTPEYTTLRRTA